MLKSWEKCCWQLYRHLRSISNIVDSDSNIVDSDSNIAVNDSNIVDSDSNIATLTTCQTTAVDHLHCLSFSLPIIGANFICSNTVPATRQMVYNSIKKHFFVYATSRYIRFWKILPLAQLLTSCAARWPPQYAPAPWPWLLTPWSRCGSRMWPGVPPCKVSSS